mgnify:CR=1 FL=1
MDAKEIVKLCALYNTGRSENKHAEIRRVLKNKFDIELTQIEIESFCALVASEAVLELVRLSRVQSV